MVLQSTRPPTVQPPTVTWDSLPDTYVLPDDPVENIQQPRLAAGLLDALGNNDLIPPNSLIASNFALVATINQKTIVKDPDWLYVPRVSNSYPSKEPIRRSYTPWAEGEAVAIVMEFLSDSDNGEHSARRTSPYGKLYFYEQILKVPTYVIFDPETAELEVRQLRNGSYALAQANQDGRFWIPELELFLGVWAGIRETVYANWLRWWDDSGNLLLWSSEQSELERLRAEEERLRAEDAIERAEDAIERATQAEQERDRFAEKLRQLGINPESL